MCGIAGFIDFKNNLSKDKLLQRLALMTTKLSHRGPDDFGLWADETSGVALGQRRLSIIDLSPQGHQPMTSLCGNYVIIFNGEIYNYLAMKAELELKGIKFKGLSDTEVLLEYLVLFGIEKALKTANGMFAFALWDKNQKNITLARDRFGQKPLYYGFNNNLFIFGSELKALKAYPDINLTIDNTVLPLFLRHNYIPSPYSIYQGIKKLDAGCYLTIDTKNIDAAKSAATKPYWSAKETALKGLNNPFIGSFDDALSELEKILSNAVSGCMIADVPLGAFLSGGFDSSTIVALMQKLSNKPILSFAIGFEIKDYNEAKYAKAVANHLGTNHTEFCVTEKDALSVIPLLAGIYDEPFADSSQIPTYLVSKLAKEYVTVCLSGDGGDEFFGGYSRYFLANSLCETRNKIPYPIKHLGASSLRLLSPKTWDTLNSSLTKLFPKRLRFAQLGTRLHKIADFLDGESPQNLYLKMISQWDKPSLLAGGLKDPITTANNFNCWSFNDFDFKNNKERLFAQMMLVDALTYMSDDILVKVDRASMANSLETRVPILDHNVFEFAWKLPFNYKVENNCGKKILKHLLYKYVPKELVERPKMGFGVPIDYWLRSDLKEWAGDLLSADSIKKQGLFDYKVIDDAFQNHLSKKANLQYPLWTILMFQSWLSSNS